MRYIVTVAALILSCGTTAGYAQKPYVSAPGTHSCGKYLAAVHGHAPGKALDLMIVGGDNFMMTTSVTWPG